MQRSRYLCAGTHRFVSEIMHVVARIISCIIFEYHIDMRINGLTLLVFQLECRRVLLLRHFEETFDQKDCLGTCDNCKRRANGDFELKVKQLNFAQKGNPAQAHTHTHTHMYKHTHTRLACKNPLRTSAKLRASWWSWCTPWVRSTRDPTSSTFSRGAKASR